MAEMALVFLGVTLLVLLLLLLAAVWLVPKTLAESGHGPEEGEDEGAEPVDPAA